MTEKFIVINLSDESAYLKVMKQVSVSFSHKPMVTDNRNSLSV